MSYKFAAEEHVGSWMPLGRNEQGDEVWCDGCCIKDKHLAERIAANMEAAYNQGLEDAARDFVQQAIRIAAAGGGATDAGGGGAAIHATKEFLDELGLVAGSFDDGGFGY